jgi:hypothetical protein
MIPPTTEAKDQPHFINFVSKKRFPEGKWRPQTFRSKAVPLHAMEALGGRRGIAPTHSRPRH